jgi:hypothetical protein
MSTESAPVSSIDYGRRTWREDEIKNRKRTLACIETLIDLIDDLCNLYKGL